MFFSLFQFYCPLLTANQSVILNSYIADSIQHEYNKELLREIINEELGPHISNWSPASKASYLSSRIFMIAQKLVDQGFIVDAYDVSEPTENTILSFNSFCIWEGKTCESETIPLTFLVYVWPSIEQALKCNASDPRNCRYASNIHSHPISCALAVLNGVLSQRNFEKVSGDPSDHFVRLVDEDEFRVGEGDVDDLKQPFIHQVYCKDPHSKIAISLHAYSLSTNDEVTSTLLKTLSERSYKLKQ